MAEDICCDTCKYFIGHVRELDGTGYCGRYPPQSPDGEDDGSSYPEMRRPAVDGNGGFCGEHQPRNARTPDDKEDKAAEPSLGVFTIGVLGLDKKARHACVKLGVIYVDELTSYRPGDFLRTGDFGFASLGKLVDTLDQWNLSLQSGPDVVPACQNSRVNRHIAQTIKARGDGR